MYGTSFYVERLIPQSALVHAFSRATRATLGSVAAIDSPELDGAVEEWGDPEKPTVLRYWTIPGEFPFAVDILFKQPEIASERDAVSILHQVAADLSVPLLSIETDVPAAFRAIFPDGTEAIVDEDLTVPDPALVLTAASRRTYDARRSARSGAALTAG